MIELEGESEIDQRIIGILEHQTPGLSSAHKVPNVRTKKVIYIMGHHRIAAYALQESKSAMRQQQPTADSGSLFFVT